MSLVVIITCLFLLMLAYFFIAKKYQIVDKPNHRSSHSSLVFRGGGVIFPIAALIYSLFYSPNYSLLVLGVIIVGAISFIDDLKVLSARVRIPFHILGVTLCFLTLDVFTLEIYFILPLYIVVIGWLNAFNFMDGINGILGLYSLAVIVPIYFINEFLGDAIDPNFIQIVGASLVVFLFFNARVRPKCFSGDVGSLSMGLILAFLVISLGLKLETIWIVGLVGVYGVDTVLTIVHRLLKKENIFEAHRSHLYQYLANEMKWGHLPVSISYGIIQLGFGLVFFNVTQKAPELIPFITIGFLGFLTIIYLIAKLIILKKLRKKVTPM